MCTCSIENNALATAYKSLAHMVLKYEMIGRAVVKSFLDLGRVYPAGRRALLAKPQGYA